MGKKEKIRKIIHIIILVLLVIILVGSFYISIYFGNESFEELYFYLTNGVSSGSLEVYLIAIRHCFPFAVPIFLMFYSLFYNILINKEIILTFNFKLLNFRIKDKKIKFYPLTFVTRHKVIFTFVIAILVSILTFYNLQIHDYVESNVNDSKFIEENYVVPEDKNINLSEKRNLIYLMVESLETTFFTKEQGGDWDYEVMPELYELLYDEDSVFFSANDKASGASDMIGTSWTTASIVANNTGLPFKVPIDGNSYYSDNFMSGAYAIGDVLKAKGYYNEVISASNTSFGGVKEFYTKHGNYNIIDVDNLSNYGFELDSNDINPWGFNDNYLYEIAKERLLDISKKEEPFNITLISIDPHATDGYIGDYSLNLFNTQYENVYATESKLIGNFIDWIKEQDFYENTTIVIVGDHLSMQSDFFKDHDFCKRYKYTVIVNPAIKGENTKNRIYTSIDMYPTALAALGAEIKEEQLGLGVNLFSGKETLAEKYGLKELEAELKKKSLFYNSKILGSDYLKMLADTRIEE